MALAGVLRTTRTTAANPKITPTTLERALTARMCTPLRNRSMTANLACRRLDPDTSWFAPLRTSVIGEGGKTMTDLEARFEQEMVEKVYRAAGRETGYWAGYFLRSVKRQGGVGAARRLLQGRGVSKGLAKLAALGRLDLAMETLVLDPAY